MNTRTVFIDTQSADSAMIASVEAPYTPTPATADAQPASGAQAASFTNQIIPSSGPTTGPSNAIQTTSISAAPLHGEVPMSTHKEIVFIDPSITDLEIFLAGLRPDVESIVLDTKASAPSQIAKALCGRSALQAVHIVAHGEAGAIRFSSGALSAETLNEHADELGGDWSGAGCGWRFTFVDLPDGAG